MRFLPISRILCASAALWAPALFAQIYAGQSANGTAVLSDFRSQEAAIVVVAAAEASTLPRRASLPGAQYRGMPIPPPLLRLLDDMGKQYRVDPGLLHAVITAESGYNARAISPKGARGLMQIMPATGQRFGAGDLFDPGENVRVGAKYLRWLLDLFNGDLELALAGYNAGEQAVIKAGYRIPPYAETRRYVPKVLNNYRPSEAK